MTTIDLFVVLAIVYFCYLGKHLINIIREEENPSPTNWYDELPWKDQ